MAIFMDIKGTSNSYFQIGKDGAKLISNISLSFPGTVLIEVRDPTGKVSSSILADLFLSRGGAIILNSEATLTGTNWPYYISRPMTGMTAPINFILPPTTGNAGDIMSANGDGSLSWIAPSVPAALASGQIIVGSALNVPTPVAMTGEAAISDAGVVILDNAAVITKVLTGFVAAPGVVTAADSIVTALEKIAGNASDDDSSYTKRDSTTLAFDSASPILMFTLPANAVVEDVQVIIDIAFDGAPALQIGIFGNINKYMTTAQVDLTSGAKDRWESTPNEIPVGTTEDIYATYTRGGATVGSARMIVSWSIPS